MKKKTILNNIWPLLIANAVAADDWSVEDEAEIDRDWLDNLGRLGPQGYDPTKLQSSSPWLKLQELPAPSKPSKELLQNPQALPEKKF